jgi:glycerophosphoryl diester phosphodiesterase
LQEIKTLRAKERLATRNQAYNGQYSIPAFAEILDLVKTRSENLHKVIGVYPETKHPSYFHSIHHPLEPVLAEELKRVGWISHGDPVIIQSFELGSLRLLKNLVGCRLVFLYDDPSERPYDGVLEQDPRTYGDYTKTEELKKLGTWLYGIGPSKRMIIPESSLGALLPPTALLSEAHEAGLAVHPYTFRSDRPFLAKEYAGDPLQEYRQFFDLGVDGVFSDFPDHALKALGKNRP